MGSDVVGFIDFFYKPHSHYLEKGILAKADNQTKEQLASLGKKEILPHKVFALQRFYLEGEIEKAYVVVEDIMPSTHLLKGHLIYIDLLFYIILIRLAKNRTLQTTEKGKINDW